MSVTPLQAIESLVGDEIDLTYVRAMETSRTRSTEGFDEAVAAAAIADAANHNMRFFNVTANGGNVSSTVWEVSDAASAPAMSAVHFFFGRHLAQHMPDVPMGMITSAVSATAIEKWATCAG